jgi:hypothetical protein
MIPATGTEDLAVDSASRECCEDWKWGREGANWSLPTSEIPQHQGQKEPIR